jgi:ABC-type Fe3+ transport system permease subunit
MLESLLEYGKKRKSKRRILNLLSIVLQHLMTSVMLPEDLGFRQAAVTIQFIIFQKVGDNFSYENKLH